MQPVESRPLPRARSLGKPVNDATFDSTPKPRLDTVSGRGNPLLTADSARSKMYEGLSSTKKEQLLAAIEKSRGQTVAAFGERAYEHAVNVLLEEIEFTG
jgi:hypothetical protein